MNQKISLGRCYSVSGALTNLWLPGVSPKPGRFGLPYSAAMGSATSNDGVEISRYVNGSYSGLSSPPVLDGTNYGVTSADYLTPATNDAGAPGQWIYGFDLRIPFVGVGNPGTLDSVPGRYTSYPWRYIQVIHGSIGWPASPSGCPWPLPYVSNPGEVPPIVLETPQLNSIYGIRFIDQFGSPLPVNPWHYQYFAATGFDYIGSGSPIAVNCSVGFGQGFAVPDLVRPDKTRLLCYPKFTWDISRMTAVANWFMQWPARVEFRRGPGGFPLGGIPTEDDIIVDGHLSIDPNAINYGPVNFVLDRPPCKFAGILNACS